MNFTLEFMIKGPILLVVTVWTYEGMPSEYCHCCITTPKEEFLAITVTSALDLEAHIYQKTNKKTTKQAKRLYIVSHRRAFVTR